MIGECEACGDSYATEEDEVYNLCHNCRDEIPLCPNCELAVKWYFCDFITQGETEVTGIEVERCGDESAPPVHPEPFYRGITDRTVSKFIENKGDSE